MFVLHSGWHFSGLFAFLGFAWGALICGFAHYPICHPSQRHLCRVVRSSHSGFGRLGRRLPDIRLAILSVRDVVSRNVAAVAIGLEDMVHEDEQNWGSGGRKWRMWAH